MRATDLLLRARVAALEAALKTAKTLWFNALFDAGTPRELHVTWYNEWLATLDAAAGVSPVDVARLTRERDAAYEDLKPYALELGEQLRRVAALTAALRAAHACATFDVTTGQCGGCAVSTALDAAAGEA